MTELHLIADDDYPALNQFFFDELLFHTRRAQTASNEWSRRKPGIVEMLRGRPGGNIDFNLRKAIADNWTLKDLLDEWSWHEREAKLMSADLVGLNAYLLNRNLFMAPMVYPTD